MNSFRVFPLSLAALALFSSPASADDLSLSADMAATAFAVRHEIFGSEEWDYPLLARLRLNGEAKYAEELLFHASYELNGTRPNGFSPVRSEESKSRLRLEDIEPYVKRSDNTVVTQNLDRLFGEYKSGPLSASLGRQAIGHGGGRIFNPSDIFAPLAVQSTYTEYKRGIDAVRASYEFAEEFAPGTLLAAHEDGADRSFYLLTAQGRFEGGNYSLYGGNTLGAGTVGLDLAADVWGAGIYTEGIIRTDEAVSENLRMMAGVHRKVTQDVSVIFELLFNGVGEKKPENYLLATMTREWKNAEVSLLGEWYGGFDISWEATPLATFSLGIIENLGDSSTLFSPKISWSAAEWTGGTLTVNLGATIGTGSRTNSEFGNYPDIYFVEAAVNL